MRSGYAMPVKDNVCPDGEDDDVVSDNDLLAAVAEGDRNSFAILMKRYLVPMVALAQRIVLDREQAREIAQEAFLRVWKHASKWDADGTATFHTWLRRVTTNLAISRKRRFRPEVTLDVIEELPSTYTDGFHALAEADNKRLVNQSYGRVARTATRGGRALLLRRIAAGRSGGSHANVVQGFRLAHHSRSRESEKGIGR